MEHYFINLVDEIKLKTLQKQTEIIINYYLLMENYVLIAISILLIAYFIKCR